MKAFVLIGKICLVLACLALPMAGGAYAQRKTPPSNTDKPTQNPTNPALGPCGGVVTIQVKEDCPQCTEFKRLYPICPAAEKVTIKPGCTVNVCVQYLKANDLSMCLIGRTAVVPCCVPGNNGLPKSGSNCLKPENMSCCDGDNCRWGCSSWLNPGPNHSTGDSHTCATESNFKKDGLNPGGLPACDCKSPGNSPLPQTMCQPGSRDRLPKDCERMICIPNRGCQFFDDCTDLGCCDKNEYCKKNDKRCKDRPEEACTKSCSVTGEECLYDCSNGCCCPQEDLEKCLEDCTLSGNKVCGKAQPVQ